MQKSKEELEQIISNILSSQVSNQERKFYEDQYIEYQKVSPNDWCINSIKLLQCKLILLICKIFQQEGYYPSIRSFCALNLSKSFQSYNEKYKLFFWPCLSSETQQFLKNSLLQQLLIEQDQNVAQNLCNAIGQIGGILLGASYKIQQKVQQAGIELSEINSWPELLPTLFQLFSQNNVQLIYYAFKISMYLFEKFVYQFENQEMIQQFYILFQKGFQMQQYPQIQLSALQALSSFISNAKTSLCKKFQSLTLQILEITFQLLITHEQVGIEAIQSIVSLVENEPKFFKPNLEVIFKTIYRIVLEKNISDSAVKIQSIEILLSLLQNNKDFYIQNINQIKQTNNQNNFYIKELFEMVFYQMVQISNTVSSEWQNPILFSRKDQKKRNLVFGNDEEGIQFGIKAIDTIFQSFDFNIIFDPPFSQFIEQMIQQEDWRYQYSAIMALSQIGEYYPRDKENQLESIIQKILPIQNSCNQKLVFALYWLIGQWSIDLMPRFQIKFKYILNSFIEQLDLDQCPKVKSTLLSAIQNFIEGMEASELEEYISSLINKLVKIIKSSKNIATQESCIQNITEIAIKIKKQFSQFFPQILNLLFDVLQQNLYSQNSEIQVLIGSIINCLASIAQNVGKNLFNQENLEKLMNILFQLQEFAINNQEAHQLQDIISAWEKIFKIISTDINQYLHLIMSRLLTFLQNRVFGNIRQEGKNDFNYELQTITNEKEEIVQSIKLIQILMSTAQSAFFQYSEYIMHIIIPLSSNQKFHSDIKVESLKCIPLILQVLEQTFNISKFNNEQSLLTIEEKELNEQYLIQKYNFFLIEILNLLQHETDSEVIIPQLRALIKIISQTNIQNILNEQLLLNIYNKIKKVIDNQNEKRKYYLKLLNQDDEESQEELELQDVEQIQQCLRIENKVLFQIAQLFDSIFQKYPLESKIFQQDFNQEIIYKNIKLSKEYSNKQFGVLLIIVQLKYNFLEQEKMLEILINELNDSIEMNILCIEGIQTFLVKNKFKNILQLNILINQLKNISQMQIPFQQEKLNFDFKTLYNQHNYFSIFKEKICLLAYHLIINYGSQIWNELGCQIYKYVEEIWLYNLPIIYHSQNSIEQHEAFLQYLEKNQQNDIRVICKIIIILNLIIKHKLFTETLLIQIQKQFFQFNTQLENIRLFALNNQTQFSKLEIDILNKYINEQK